MRTTLALACVLLIATPAVGASMTVLGDQPEIVATAVSADGSVVVGSRASNVTGYAEAYRWTSSSGFVGLGDVLAGDFGVRAHGVSADGSVVVGTDAATQLGEQGFRWTSESGMIGLGFRGSSHAVSADGSVVVGSGYPMGAGYEAFRWTAATGRIGLGDLPGGGIPQATAWGVSADGSVVVGQGISAMGREAFRWTSDGGMVGLGDLSGGTFESLARDANANGSIVVGVGNSELGREAFRWTSDGGMVGLGDLPGGSFGSAATGISDDGLIIVGTGTSESGEAHGEAFRWTVNGGMQRLWDVLVAHGVDPAASGWTILSGASAVSADGNTIVGDGFHDGTRKLFIAVVPVPEPWGLYLLGFGAVPLLAWRPHARVKPLDRRPVVRDFVS